MTNSKTKFALVTLIVSCFLAGPALATKRTRAKVNEKVVRDAISRIEKEMREAPVAKIVKSFMETRQMKLIAEKANELLETGVARNEAEAAELTLKAFSANRLERALVSEPLRAIKNLRKEGNAELAREGILFVYNAATTMKTRSSRINEQNPQGADVVLASLNALRLSKDFEGSGINPLKEMLARINKEFETTRDIETAAEKVVEGEKRKEFVENCKK